MQCRAKNNRLTDSPHVIGYCQSQGMTPSDGRVQPPERKHKQTHAMKLLEKPLITINRKELAQLLFDLRSAKDQMLDDPNMCAPQALLVNPITKLEELLDWGKRWENKS